jgi:lipoate---protein ligase
MLLIKLESTNPYFNFATEEYLLNNFDEDIFVCGIYDDSISVGVNQNTMGEINAMYVKQNNIKVVRRNSGGGTVFHDKACINYSFIFRDDESAIDDFSRFTEPILGFLNNKLKLDASFRQRNDIIIDDKKVSGMSKYKMNGKIVQHGTLMFASSIKSMVSAIKIHPEKMKAMTPGGHDIPFANIISFIPGSEITANKFMESLSAYVKSINETAQPYSLTKEDIENINKLVEEKYSTWDWNYGQSPDYDYKKSINCPCGLIEVLLKVENGIIKDAKIYGDFFSENDITELEEMFKNRKHRCDVMLKALENIDITKYFGDISKEFLVNSLFAD